MLRSFMSKYLVKITRSPLSAFGFLLRGPQAPLVGLCRCRHVGFLVHIGQGIRPRAASHSSPKRNYHRFHEQKHGPPVSSRLWFSGILSAK